MTMYALEQTRAELQLCSFYFGKSPYDEIHITEQPNFNFGQSWPSLVYLPLSAYTDSTQRWMLFGGINNKFTGFVQEVTPHEVAHQWWGHAVGWASYHDQWLSEGFAEFSAGLFLQQAVGRTGGRTTSIFGRVCASACWRRIVLTSPPTMPGLFGWDCV